VITSRQLRWNDKHGVVRESSHDWIVSQVLQVLNNSNVNVGAQTVNIGPQSASSAD